MRIRIISEERVPLSPPPCGKNPQSYFQITFLQNFLSLESVKTTFLRVRNMTRCFEGKPFEVSHQWQGGHQTFRNVLPLSLSLYAGNHCSDQDNPVEIFFSLRVPCQKYDF